MSLERAYKMVVSAGQWAVQFIIMVRRCYCQHMVKFITFQTADSQMLQL